MLLVVIAAAVLGTEAGHDLYMGLVESVGDWFVGTFGKN